MVYDCLCFFNELDVLDIRLHTLDEVVDRFVIVESRYTHQRKQKALCFEENKSRYAAFEDKIIHVVVEECPPVPKACLSNIVRWQLENFQRNAAVRGLVEAEDSDVVMISDCDEIPNPNLVRHWTARIRHGEIIRFYERLYYTYLNLRDLTEFMWTQGTQMFTLKTFRDPITYRDFMFGEPVSREFNQGGTMTQMRFCRPSRCLFDAGWHFSYLGDINHIVRKLESIAEGPSVLTSIGEIGRIKIALRDGSDILGRGHQFMVEDTSALPDYVARNAELLRHHLFRGSLRKNVRIYSLRWCFRERVLKHVIHTLWFVKHRILLRER